MALYFVMCLFAVAGHGTASFAGALSCWTEDALRSKPSEKRIRRQRSPAKATVGNIALPDVSANPTKHAAAPTRGIIRRVDLPEDKKWLALTLDFCEQRHEIAGYDGAIIDYLRDQEVAATLFMGGKWMRSHRERTQQLMADPLFELANHGDVHRDLRRSSPAQIDKEIIGPNATYQALRTELTERQCFKDHHASGPALAQHLSFFRFPYGTCNKTALRHVNAAGMTAIQWDFSAWDSARSQTAHKIARRMVRDVKPGSIVLAHANGRGYHTAEALKIAIPKLRKKGFRFVTVGALLAAGTPVIAQSCYNTRPGDTNRFSSKRKSRKSQTTQPRGSGWSP